MLEVRTNSFCLTSGLIPCRLHQGHIPARTFAVIFDKAARAQGICQSFSIMQICWGAIDHGRGNSGSTPLSRPDNAEFPSQGTTFRTRQPIWMICCVGVLTG